MQDMANKFGKPDIERLGLFLEMPYFEEKYVSPSSKLKFKGRNMICDYGRKSKTGTQHGYFDKEFRRLFIGEAIVRDNRKKKKEKASLPPFVPAGSPKLHSGAGDFYGTFGGVVKAFGTGRIIKKKAKVIEKVLPNPITSPGKKGGPGYVDICLSKYPKHTVDKYEAKYNYKQYGQNLHRPMNRMHCPQPYFEKNPFSGDGEGPTYVEFKSKSKRRPGFLGGNWIPAGPSKWQGGCHDGMFDKFPEYQTDRDPKREAKEKQKMAKEKKSMGGSKFLTQSMGEKTMFTTSIIPLTTGISMNATNYTTYEPTYTKRLL